TEKLSPLAQMVLLSCGRVCRRLVFETPSGYPGGVFLYPCPKKAPLSFLNRKPIHVFIISKCKGYP
ncbi:hypothetical protein, partial [Salegentibacter chungangensis]